MSEQKDGLAQHPAVWRVRYCGQWMYFEDKANAEIYAQGDDNTEPLYTATLTPAACSDLSCAADFLDNIEVDENGKCEWTAVANAQTHIRAALRCWHSQEVAQLRAAIKRIDAINDNPARFSLEIDEVCRPFTSTVGVTDSSGDVFKDLGVSPPPHVRTPNV